MAYRNYGMYNSACPQTPAPPRANHRFPMSAAILETPSIMSSFREATVPCPKNPTPAPTEPPAMQFITPFASSSWTESSMFGGNPASVKPSRAQGLNNSFLDRSFSSTYSKSSSVKSNVPLVPLHSNSMLNRSFIVPERKYTPPTSSGFPTLGNFHRAKQGTNLNATMPLFNISSSLASKRKFPEPTAPMTSAPSGPSKYVKISQGNIRALPAATSSTPDEVKIILDAKATLRIVSGTIDHILKIIREQPKYPLLLETVANVLSVKAGTRAKEKVVLLRHHNAGPVLQAVYYEIDADLPPFGAGDLVRCVGRIQPVGNRLQILKITRTTEQHDRAIARLQTVSAFTTKVRR
ncbi:hypothetical protein ZHAS_00019414 [Anopheles sinensis]|uniref:Uncharacterized protein n=1 Tax=Anopheles sinensis TaxID=74873 RepID=A0A084WLR2_ANOSI|nr:hypothetical protein ZHAS_00019414 [Anopheles sinensis]